MSLISSAPASSTAISTSSSPSDGVLGTITTPLRLNRYETEPASAIDPPLRVSATRTSEAARGVALIGHCLVRGAACLQAGPAADGPVDVVVRRRAALGLGHGVIQRRVGVHVWPAAARRHLDVLDQLGEQPAAPGVDDRLLVLRGRPLGVAAHDSSLTMSVKIACTRLSWVSSGWNAVASA